MVRAKITGFPPVAAPDARILILGSMPSVESLRRTEYYGHSRNLFWDFMGEFFGASRELPYRRRLRVLVKNRVALWDVARRCRREQSADATMEQVEPNDIPGLLGRCRRVRAVFLNGRKAEELFLRLVWPELGECRPSLHRQYLPSTSPANARLRPGAKLGTWRGILEWL
ncbi:MAG: DNA-deoxyinosine glycosylase [Planctomycetota bacterium]